MIIWLVYGGILLYWEVVYHFGCFGLTGADPLLTLGILAVLASLQALITGWVDKKHNRKIFWMFLLPEYLVFAVQTVYYTIFRQPLQLRAMVMGGQDALTNYWREALAGIGKSLPVLLILALPLIAAALMFYKKKWLLPVLKGIQKVRIAFVLGIAFLACWMVLEIGKVADADFYDEYTEFYDPTIIAQDMGVITMVQRDLGYEMEQLADAVFSGIGREEIPAIGEVADSSKESAPESGDAQTQNPGETDAPESGETVGETETPEEEPLPAYNVKELDLQKLAQLSAGDAEKEWLAGYIAGLEPTNTNEYTGLFEDYNLIYITAEGFSTYAVSAELTPTLYKLVNSGFVFTNYYVPLWQTSTSDGEYVNLTGMIPDGQFSMRKTQNNNMAYALPRFFADEGVPSYGYHNNTLGYYDRHLTHPNLGYHFKASKLGDLSEAEWGHLIFPMENAERWPASDLNMMQATVAEYVNNDRFHVYYMTVSGHMYYTFKGNSMSSKNKDAVAELTMSENARAYIACHIELDKALEYLLDELEKAGKAENTIIALSADHYPYAMTQEQYEELAGKDLSNDMDTYRNSLILYSASMEESIMVTKPCCSVDVLPTLMNLLGFDYDARMYAGRDILSDAEGLVIFNDRSFVTDTVVYDRKSKTTTWKKELSEEEKESYLEAMKQEVKDRYQFSAYVLRENYYDIVQQCETDNGE